MLIKDTCYINNDEVTTPSNFNSHIHKPKTDTSKASEFGELEHSSLLRELRDKIWQLVSWRCSLSKQKACITLISLVYINNYITYIKDQFVVLIFLFLKNSNEWIKSLVYVWFNLIVRNKCLYFQFSKRVLNNRRLYISLELSWTSCY